MSLAAEEARWQTLRGLFPMLREVRYLAACSQAPLCSPVEAAINRFMESWRRQGNPWESEWMPTVARCADRFAQLIGAPPGSIGVNASVSAAVAAVLSAVDFEQRRRVVVSALDFPTVPDILLAYSQKGAIELDVLPEQHGEIPLESYERGVDERTALVCISSASYATGAQLPIKAVAQLARARGALCLVDAFQTAGALALNVAELRPDFLITGTLKYLLGSMGVAFIYAAPDVAERLEPRSIGWHAAADPFSTNFDRLEYAPGAARFQAGTFIMPGCYAAEAALDLLLETGTSAIEQRVLGLSQRFADGLNELGVRPAGPAAPGKLGPMLALPVRGDAHALQERIRRDHGVVTAARGSSLRFAFHFFNDDSDVDACLSLVQRLCAEGVCQQFPG